MLSVLQLTRIAKIKDTTQNVTDYQSCHELCDGRKLYDTSYSIACQSVFAEIGLVLYKKTSCIIMLRINFQLQINNIELEETTKLHLQLFSYVNLVAKYGNTYIARYYNNWHCKLLASQLAGRYERLTQMTLALLCKMTAKHHQEM